MMHSRSGQSSYRDRTLEFTTVAERLSRSLYFPPDAPSGNIESKLEGPKSVNSIQSEFNKKASGIGLGIHQASQKLVKLAQLAKRTSVFDDPTVEIQQLTAVIKEDITALNSAVVELQLLCKSQNECGNMSTDTTNHSATVVDNLKSRLMSATKEFKEVLTMRTENLKVHENRQLLFSSSTSKDASNHFVRRRTLVSRTMVDSAASPAPWENDSSSSSQLFSRKKSNGDTSSSQPLLSQQQQQHHHHSQEQLMVPAQESYMHSRTEALQNVESTINELGSIFTQLATMVSQQGELAIRIDENMDDTLTNVEGAQGQLLKYLTSISSNRLLEFGVTISSPNPESKSTEDEGKRSIIDLGNGSEVIYAPRFLPSERAWAWFDYLDKEIPWTRPSIHVFGRYCLQPRDTCYVASKGLSDLKYSGYQPPAYTWEEFPVLGDILQAVHKALPGSGFNSVLLNRYKSGSDYVAWHSDNEKLYGPNPEIASVSLGCERPFLLKKKPAKKEVLMVAVDASDEPRKKRLKTNQQEDVRSFLLKHGSLLVMSGYTQRDWVHSVPKRSMFDSVRINLTFRRILM